MKGKRRYQIDFGNGVTQGGGNSSEFKNLLKMYREQGFYAEHEYSPKTNLHKARLRKSKAYVY